MQLQNMHFWYGMGNLDSLFGFLIAHCLWPKKRDGDKRPATCGSYSPMVIGGLLFDQWYCQTAAAGNLLFIEVSAENFEEVQALIAVFRHQFPEGLVVAYQPGNAGAEPLLTDGIFATFHELPIPGQPWDLVSRVEDHQPAART